MIVVVVATKLPQRLDVLKRLLHYCNTSVQRTVSGQQQQTTQQQQHSTKDNNHQFVPCKRRMQKYGRRRPATCACREKCKRDEPQLKCSNSWRVLALSAKLIGGLTCTSALPANSRSSTHQKDAEHCQTVGYRLRKSPVRSHHARLRQGRWHRSDRF